MALVCDVCGKGKGKAMYAVTYAHLRNDGISITLELVDGTRYIREGSSTICISCVDKLHIHELARKLEADMERYRKKKEDEELIDVTPKELGPGRSRMRLLGNGQE